MNRIDLKRFPITTALLVANIAYYLYTSVSYGFNMSAQAGFMAGGFVPMVVVEMGQYWRFITANFVHFGFIHILVNMFSLYNVGPFVEYNFKKWEYICIIITSMFFTNAYGFFNYMINGIGGLTVSGGASGIIFGILGAIVVLGIYYQGYYERVLKSLLPSLILMIFISFSMSSISLSGHLGGLLGGMISTYIIIQIRNHKKNNSGHSHFSWYHVWYRIYVVGQCLNLLYSLFSE